MVTAGTYLKRSIFRGGMRLEFLCDTLLDLAERYKWELQAWAVFPNHYHFVALCTEKAAPLTAFTKHLHSVTGIEANRWEGSSGQKIWFQFWDTALTYPESYDARLSYVHRNAVHHGIVREPSLYSWCSAGWFQRRAGTSFYKRIMALKIDRVNVQDDFVVEPADV